MTLTKLLLPAAMLCLGTGCLFLDTTNIHIESGGEEEWHYSASTFWNNEGSVSYATVDYRYVIEKEGKLEFRLEQKGQVATIDGQAFEAQSTSSLVTLDGVGWEIDSSSLPEDLNRNVMAGRALNALWWRDDEGVLRGLGPDEVLFELEGDVLTTTIIEPPELGAIKMGPFGPLAMSHVQMARFKCEPECQWEVDTAQYFSATDTSRSLDFVETTAGVPVLLRCYDSVELWWPDGHLSLAEVDTNYGVLGVRENGGVVATFNDHETGRIDIFLFDEDFAKRTINVRKKEAGSDRFYPVLAVYSIGKGADEVVHLFYKADALKIRHTQVEVESEKVRSKKISLGGENKYE
jgi:hypothetical protein